MIEVERKKDIPLVTVRCTVYNHEKYLRNCLDGIVMQKTNFVFHAIVHDDASTDKSAVIIKEYATRYPTIIKPIFEMENQYSKGGEFLSRIMEEHTLGKYVAYCEGDDYWTDPYKLQKEVDILERNNNVKLVYTSYSNVDEDGNLIIRPAYERNKRISHSGNILGELFNRNFVMTVTVCLRKDILDTELYKNCKWKYDYSFTFAASMLGEVVYLPDDTSCYRLNPNSLTQVKRKQVLGDLEKIKEYYALALLNNEGRRYNLREKILLRLSIMGQREWKLFFKAFFSDFLCLILSPFALIVKLVREIMSRINLFIYVFKKYF